MSPRIKAFLIHLVISLIILVALLYVVVYQWYPPPFFAADGGWRGVQLIVGVDLILGPLLTLSVYNPGKGMDRLKRDLWTIGIIQIVALSVGSYIVEDQRTRMVTFANNRFVSMSESQIRESGVSKEVLQSLKSTHPPMAYVSLPDDPAAKNALLMSNLGSTPLFKRGDLYAPLTLENRQKILKQGYELNKVAEVFPDLAPMITAFLEDIGKTSDQVRALPLYCRYGVLALVMDLQSGEILDSIKIDHDVLITSLSWKRKRAEAKQ